MARCEATGKSASGWTDKDGHYELGTMEPGDGVLPGEYFVMLMEDRGDMDNPRPATISPKYRNPQVSGLKFSVEPGESTVFDVTLDSL